MHSTLVSLVNYLEIGQVGKMNRKGLNKEGWGRSVSHYLSGENSHLLLGGKEAATLILKQMSHRRMPRIECKPHIYQSTGSSAFTSVLKLSLVSWFFTACY